MPSVTDVRPKIWKKETVLDLYDDGDYSAIWGAREDSSCRTLGVRWNGNNNYQGYPNQGSNPVWYSEPDFLTPSILHALLANLVRPNEIGRKEEFINNIIIALRECKKT